MLGFACPVGLADSRSRCQLRSIAPRMSRRRRVLLGWHPSRVGLVILLAYLVATPSVFECFFFLLLAYVTCALSCCM